MQMRHVVGVAVPVDDFSRFCPALDRIGSIVTAVYPKHVFGIVPHFSYHTGGVRKESAILATYLPLAPSEHHDRNVLIGIISSPLWISENNYRTAPCASAIPFLVENRISLPTGWQEKRQVVLRIVVAKWRVGYELL